MMGPKSGYRNRLFKAIHAEALKRGLDHDAVHEMCAREFGAESMSSLTDGQLLTIYRGWTGHGLKRKAALPTRGELDALAPVMAAPEDLQMMDAEFAKRGLGAEGKQAFIRRQLRGREVLRTRRDVVRVTAGLRAMNRRDGIA
jgi:hypothetical protein